MKKACINQRFGLGDHIFTISLCRRLIAEGYEVIYPVEPQYVEGNQAAYCDILWEDCDKLEMGMWGIQRDFEIAGIRWIPLAWSMEISKRPYKDVMRAKYEMYGLPFETWRENAAWVRYPDHEQRLFDTLGIAPGEKYILVNKNYQTDFKGQAKIHIVSPYRVVQMDKIAGFSLFDWSALIEQAQEIHTVSTSLFYMLELMDLKQPIHLYPRNNDPDFSHIKYMFTKDYILHL